MKSLQELTRLNIWALKPYSSARDEYSGKEASVFLDANENPYNTPNNRYPDPLQRELKNLIAPIKGVKPSQVFLGNGSDEAIDLIYRCFTRPQTDNVVAIEPTSGMYKVCADINDVEYRPVQLDADFQLSADKLLAACDANTKVIWICSPNNPSGNSLNRSEILKVLSGFDGLVVIDEAYSDFSSEKPFRLELDQHPNMIILNTFSKAWGCAAIRLGMAFANAFLGVCHSMAHKLGAFHHLPHGIANAILITDVMRFNAAEVPAKMGTFSQYAYPHCKERYLECANFLGIQGKNDDEKFENFLTAIEELKAKVGIKKTIKDYGVDEKYFLDTLDDMVEQAFDDQCTGANPRYPLMREIKEMYLKAYYGK